MPKTIHSLFNPWILACLLFCGFSGLSAQIDVQLNGTDPFCTNLAAGSVVSNVTGAVPPIAYSWSNGATTSFIENLLAGTYSVTVTDNGGNTDIASITLVEPDQVTLDLSANQTCQEPFVISANAGGGVPPFTYNWSTGASTPSITVNSGNYCVTIVDANLCGTFDCIDVEVMQPTVSVTGVNIQCFGGENGSLTAIPGPEGTPPFTYTWNNGSNGQVITGLNAGTYRVTLTDAGGCTATATGTVTQPAQLNVTASNDGPACPGIFLTTATAFPTGGTPPYSFLWSTGAFTQAVSSLNSGTFSVTVTDANNCTTVTSTTIQAADPPVLTIEGDRVICGVGNVGSLTATVTNGTPGYQFSWSNGAQTPTIANLQPGTYIVTVTDANGCTDVESATLTLIDVNVSLAQTNINCFGANNGTASAIVTGGSLPYTYVWSNGATTQTISGLTPGSYSVTITEANNCKASGTVTIIQPTPIIVIPSVSNILCAGDNNGAIDISVSGGTPGYSYVWSNGSVNQDLTNVQAGTYTVTVTDANGCIRTSTATISEPAQLVSNSSPTNIACAGDATGRIDVSVSGGVAPYTYLWSTGATSQDLFNLTAGTYSVTITDANNCTSFEQETITQPTPIVLSTTKTDVLCAGQATGTINLTVSGGSGNYAYVWSTGSNQQDLSGLPAGTYSVTVTDANECTRTTSVTINQPTPLVVTQQVTNVLCNGDFTGAIDLGVSGGTPAYSYAWSNGSVNQDLTNVQAGTYTVTITDANNCTVARTLTISQPTQLVTSVNATNVACAGDATGSVNLNVSGGVSPYTYLWSNGAVSQDIAGLTAGTYSVTITDANNCTNVEQATITQPTPIVLSTTKTDVLCAGQATGTINLTVSGGSGNYAYAWSTGSNQQDLNGLPAGTYSVTVTDANECTATTSVTITQPTPLVITQQVTNLSCFNNSSGAIDLSVSGGTPAYSYAWSNGSVNQDLNNVAAGTYSVTVTDASGCSATRTLTISQPTNLISSVSATDIACADDVSGSINLNVSGGVLPYTYLWSNGATSQDLSNLTAGTYSVTITDANNCTNVEQATITQPTPIVLSTSNTDVLCAGQATGTINLTVSGGSGNYAYVWSTGSNQQDLNGLPAGTYSVTVTDANECTATTSVTITQPTPLVITQQVTNVLCNGDFTGAIDLSVSGGTPAYSYAWSNGSVNQDLTNVQAGTYTVTVTDANGCRVNRTLTISQPTELTATVAGSDTQCNGTATGAATVTASGGTLPYAYLWSNGAITQTVNGLVAGFYSVTVTDGNNCTTVAFENIDEVSSVVLGGTSTNVTCNGGNDGSVNLNVSGGTLPYAYIWSNGAISQDLSNLSADIYNVTVTDGNGCNATASFTISEPDAINLTVNAPIIQCGGTAGGSITVIPTGGTGTFSYLWSNGAITQTIDNLMAGTYSVTVTDVNGCTDVAQTISLQEVPQLSCEVIIDQQPTTGNNGSLSVDIDGGTFPYTYLWSDGATTAVNSGLSAGTYSVTVTDANGCVTSCTGTLAALAGIGDFVWEDLDLDGVQDENEPGVPNVTVNLKNEAGVVIATTTTNEEGFYSFVGLQPGTYSVQFVIPDGFDYTAQNVGGDDTIDNDIIAGMNGMTGQYTLVGGEFNMTVDAGIIVPPNGIIADPCYCLDNATNSNDGQFSEEMVITSYSGLSWSILEQTNMYLNAAINDPPAPLVSVPLGTLLEERPLVGQPGFSEYVYAFRLVDELTYTVTVQAGLQVLSFSNTCFYPNISFDEQPPAQLCRFDPDFPLDANSMIPGNFTYTIAGQTVEVLDPSTLPVGTYDLTVTLNPDDDEECEGVLVLTFDIVDDCDAKIGDFVWFDEDFDGVQDPGEDGIPNVKVIITSQDETYMDMQFTDENGMYMFMVNPGTYKITFEQPSGLIASPANQGGDDALDSDVMPGMLMTEFITLGPDEINMTVDAGFYDPCIANVNNPGTIGFDQELCGPGNVPDILVELTPASGGVGEMNYLWMYNTVDPTQNINFWHPIPNTNSINFQPGPLYESTYFTRCVRRNNCVFIESNVIFIEVGDDASANIDGPNLVCEGETVTYSAPGSENADNVQWSFSGPANVTINGDNSATIFWGSFGSFSATLSVTENGCTATRIMRVSVINNPATCGDGFTANGTINNLVSREINVNWLLPMDGSDLVFTVERSLDGGTTFEAIGTITQPSQLVNGTDGWYSYDDVSPLAGRNYYRVRLTDDQGNEVVSNTIMLMLSNAPNSLGRVFPNPIVDDMIHVEMLEGINLEQGVSIQLYSGTGNLITSKTATQGGFTVDLPLSSQPAGIYFLRIVNGDKIETHRVMVSE